MENENGNLFNPVQNFLYSLILRRFTHSIAQTLSHYYTTMGGTPSDLCAWPPPIDDPAPPEKYVEGDAITLDANGFSYLFLYHFLDSCTLPEMTAEEVAWVLPSLEAFFAKEDRTLYFDIPKLAYLLWLYERKRLPLGLHERLLHRMVWTYQTTEDNEFLRLPDPEKITTLWNDAFAALVKANLPVAREKEEARRIHWEEEQLRRHTEEKEEEARRLAEYEKRRGEEELDQAAGAFAADLVTRYAANPAAFAHRFSLPADHPEVREVITGYNLRGVLDDQGTLWIRGSGRLTRRFLSQLS
ncbi:MAG: hypothetical protein IKZ21_06940, partial [Clostridia bacterium]|nr:hypothetical protein [Clostridia bacterium]